MDLVGQQAVLQDTCIVNIRMLKFVFALIIALFMIELAGTNGVRVNLPQFNGDFHRATIVVIGVSK